MVHLVHQDAFSSGQITSKLWLCEELEKLAFDKPQVVWLLGGWYGISAFLLLSRNILPIKHVRSFDIDPSVESVADMINENWVWQKWKFKAFTRDCNFLNFGRITDVGETPDIIINTSSEHFENLDWWQNIPAGKLVVIQSNNLKHEDHVISISDYNELLKLFPMATVLYAGEKSFNYGQHNSYTRYMIIGYK